jgi:hypothetical protein
VNGATNNEPNDLVFVEPNYDPNGICGCLIESGPVGVWYDTTMHEWAAFREDSAAMPAGEGYNVLVVPSNNVGTAVFVQTSTTANTNGDYTLINNPLTNGRPGARIEVTQNWNPGGVGGAYNNHNIGVWYDSVASEWGIFNEDVASMPLGVSFNVMVGSAPSNGGQSTVLRANAKYASDTAVIKNAETTGNPNNVVFVTQNWNPNGKSGVFNDCQTGVTFDYTGVAGEGVFNGSGTQQALSSTYNLLIFSS